MLLILRGVKCIISSKKNLVVLGKCRPQIFQVCGKDSFDSEILELLSDEDEYKINIVKKSRNDRD